MIVPVILSGGSGTRLWPLSRSAYPKQFLPLVSDTTMFQETVERLSGLTDCAQPLVVCNEEHRFLVAEQLRQQEIKPSAIMLEPVGRNTAPAVACAALFAQDLDPEAVLLVMPSDHVIQKPALFVQAVEMGMEAAGRGKLATFGIVAGRPETGYGYIRKSEPGEAAAKDLGAGVYSVAEFVEKPDLETASQYVQSGNYFWNSGMFLFRADAYLNELQQHFPEILENCREAYQGRRPDKDFLRLEKERFVACPAESIDYAVMEKTNQAVVVPMDAGWSDVGSWSSLSDVIEGDQWGNVVAGDVLAKDVKNSYLRSENRLIAGLGLENLVVGECLPSVVAF